MPSPSIPGTIESEASATAPNGNNIATALFDFNGEHAGDLTFKAGDKIEIIRRMEEPSGWWMGSLNGKKGTFPGK
jgi:amphiphysin